MHLRAYTTRRGRLGAVRLYFASFSVLSAMEINPIRSEITALQARFNALRGYL